jgi:hypothetical protein
MRRSKTKTPQVLTDHQEMQLQEALSLRRRGEFQAARELERKVLAPVSDRYPKSEH